MKSIQSYYLLLLVVLLSCIDPLDENLEGSTDRLVVFGEISNLKEPYTIYLSRSSSYDIRNNPKITGATVSIVDSLGVEYIFEETEEGVYQSCPEEFMGELLQKYQLRILTPEDETYQSDFELLRTPATVDSIYFEKSTGFFRFENRLYQEPGVRFFCDFTDRPEKEYLWVDWEGEFKFKSSDYDTIYDYCWKTEYPTFALNLFNDVYTNNTTNRRYEVHFLPKGWRFKEGYSFNIYLKSISQGAFIFWDLVNQQVVNDGSIFSALPSEIPSNIYNVNDPEEVVLGYFTVAGIDLKRARVSKYYYLNIGGDLPMCQPFGRNPVLPDYCYNCSKYLNSTGEQPDYW